jgi:hypothetical protein
MRARKPERVVAAALANKLARICWAIMTAGEVFRQEISPGPSKVIGRGPSAFRSLAGATRRDERQGSPPNAEDTPRIVMSVKLAAMIRDRGGRTSSGPAAKRAANRPDI